MRLLVVLLVGGIFSVFAGASVSPAATVTCVVKKIQGSTLVLENCDERLAKDFQMGAKVKVRQQKKHK